MKTHIVVHHSATADSGTVSWGAIERYHRETNGWSDIGYHAGVELVGDSYYSLIGRRPTWAGAACREANMNRSGLHVCCVGDYDQHPPTLGMIRCLIDRVILPWMEQYGITADNVIGHREAGLSAGFDFRAFGPDGKRQYKTCPGLAFDLDALRRMVR